MSGWLKVGIDWAVIPETKLYYGMAQGLSGNRKISYSQPEKLMEIHIANVYIELMQIAAFTIKIYPDSGDITGA